MTSLLSLVVEGSSRSIPTVSGCARRLREFITFIHVPYRARKTHCVIILPNPDSLPKEWTASETKHEGTNRRSTIVDVLMATPNRKEAGR